MHNKVTKNPNKHKKNKTIKKNKAKQKNASKKLKGWNASTCSYLCTKIYIECEMLDWGKIPSTSFSLGCFLSGLKSSSEHTKAYKVLGRYSFPFFLRTSNTNLPIQYANSVEGISSSAVVTRTTPSQCTSAVTLLAAHSLQTRIPKWRS